jgi:hypothetical protein
MATPTPDQQYIKGYKAGVEYCCVFRPSLAVAATTKPLAGMSAEVARGFMDCLQDYITMYGREE